MVRITTQDFSQAVPQNNPNMFIGDVLGQQLVAEGDAPSQRVTAISFVDGARNRWHKHSTEAQLPDTMASYFPGSRHLAVGDFDPDGKPVMVTEYGGVSYAPESGEEWFGYGKVRNAEEYAEQYEALTRALDESSLICGFCYTQLTDTEQETNGLLTAAREPKIPMELASAITRGEKA